MSDIKRINPGPRMTQALVYNGIAFLAGQVGTPGDSVADQTATILAKIDALLAEVGSDKSRILQATIWMDDMAAFADMNAVWDAWVDPANTPARATGSAHLATPEHKVEIIVTAAV